jgi:hypothetical protein
MGAELVLTGRDLRALIPQLSGATAMGLASLVSLNFQGSQDSTLDLGKAAFTVNKTYSVSFQNGTL